MAAEQLNFALPKPETFFNTRLLGAIGIIGAPMLLAEGAYRALTHLADNQNNQLVGLLGTIYICGWACSAIGMRRLRVTGKSKCGAAIFILQMIGLLLAGSWSIQEILHLSYLTGSALFGIADAAWPLSHLFMLVVGGFILKAGVWRGWRRIPAFLCGLALPAFFALSALGAREVGIILFGLMTTAGFMLLGYAVRRSI